MLAENPAARGLIVAHHCCSLLLLEVLLLLAKFPTFCEDMCCWCILHPLPSLWCNYVKCYTHTRGTRRPIMKNLVHERSNLSKILCCDTQNSFLRDLPNVQKSLEPPLKKEILLCNVDWDGPVLVLVLIYIACAHFICPQKLQLLYIPHHRLPVLADMTPGLDPKLLTISFSMLWGLSMDKNKIT